MSETRSVKLHFFDEKVCDQFLGLCEDLGYKASGKRRPDDSFDAETEPLQPTQRRTLISKWSDKSVQRS
jgi:hypothetical protein